MESHRLLSAAHLNKAFLASRDLNEGLVFGRPSVELVRARMVGRVVGLLRDERGGPANEAVVVLQVDDGSGVVLPVLFGKGLGSATAAVQAQAVNLEMGSLVDALGRVYRCGEGTFPTFKPQPAIASGYMDCSSFVVKVDPMCEVLRWLEIVNLFKNHYYKGGGAEGALSPGLWSKKRKRQDLPCKGQGGQEKEKEEEEEEEEEQVFGGGGGGGMTSTGATAAAGGCSEQQGSGGRSVSTFAPRTPPSRTGRLNEKEKLEEEKEEATHDDDDDESDEGPTISQKVRAVSTPGSILRRTASDAIASLGRSSSSRRPPPPPPPPYPPSLPPSLPLSFSPTTSLMGDSGGGRRGTDENDVHHDDDDDGSELNTLGVAADTLPQLAERAMARATPQQRGHARPTTPTSGLKRGSSSTSNNNNNNNTNNSTSSNISRGGGGDGGSNTSNTAGPLTSLLPPLPLSRRNSSGRLPASSLSAPHLVAMVHPPEPQGSSSLPTMMNGQGIENGNVNDNDDDDDDDDDGLAAAAMAMMDALGR